MNSKKSLGIPTEKFNKNLLKFNGYELMYEGKQFHLITPYIPIYIDRYNQIKIYDNELIELFNSIETLLETNISNKLVRTYTNNEGNEVKIIRLKPYTGLSKTEIQELTEPKRKEYRMMIAFGNIYHIGKNNYITPKIVRVKSRIKDNNKVMNDYEKYEFSE